MHALKITIYRFLPQPIQLLIRRTLFPTYLVAAKVIVKDEHGRYLAVKTTYHPGWDIPSGHCDRFESPTDAAARELLEETGIVAENLTHQAVIFQPITGTVQVVFTATCSSTAPLTPDNVEVSEIRWVSLDEVPLNRYASEAIDVVEQHQAHYWVSSLGH